MSKRIVSVLAGLGMLLFAGCGSKPTSLGPNLNSRSTSLSSGIAGEVRRGPIAPVAHEGEENTAPQAGATIVVKTSQGAVLGYVLSDQEGSFLVALAPGDYILEPRTVAGTLDFGAPAPQSVTVLANLVAHVQIEYDTGIR